MEDLKDKQRKMTDSSASVDYSAQPDSSLPSYSSPPLGQSLKPEVTRRGRSSSPAPSASSLKPESTRASRSRSLSPGESKRKWYHKFKSQPEQPGKEKWRDASLPDKERWKEWQKAKDKERQRGYVVKQAGSKWSGLQELTNIRMQYYADFYRPKNGGGAWWLGLLGGDGE